MVKKGKNVILITIDALRADHLGCLGYNKQTSPNIDSLAENGALFTQAIANGPTTWSSFQSILTSTYPLMYGGYSRFSDYRTTIAEVLKERGYLTAAIVSNTNLSSYFKYNRGFDAFEDFLRDTRITGSAEKRSIANSVYNLLHSRFHWFLTRARPQIDFFRFLSGNLPYARSEVINKKTVDLLVNHLEKFFLWLHYMNPHYPYMPHARAQSFLKRIRAIKLYKKMMSYPEDITDSELGVLINLYDREIRHVDQAIGTLFDELRKMGIWLDNTFIIVTADHGEEFRDHGEFDHNTKLYDELIHVPLIISGPGIKSNIVVKDIVSLLDLAPTILDLLSQQGVEDFLGTSMLPTMKGQKDRKSRAVISECFGRRCIRDGARLVMRRIKHGGSIFSYRTDEWKYVLDVENKRHELYNLKSDPKETENLSTEETEKTKEFESKILQHISMEKTISEERGKERQRIKTKIKRLKSLGRI